ncbi:MAG TPA: hypothetical protein IGS52_16250 [Oscillatoriaceae cyanobacterium M33_DOE_052]|uniref:Uncharacterized protein n=1 Tax=Planktothricoides sp. SpSt-374 TaxID=2282167 RepID=A0A7C3VUN3_9CYAN|nr:hypothetical protein [Oscillatoriaceae cyanobacterium M33_DOE_052]
MSYTFDILGVSPLIDFFYQQQQLPKQKTGPELAYLGAHKCTLDAFIDSAERVSPAKEWNLDRVVDTVINFWLHNQERVSYWKERLEDAGEENLLVARVADIDSLRTTFDSLLRDQI